MFLKRITDLSDPMLEEALQLYHISFPYHERREERSQREILSDREYSFNLIYDGDLYVGLLLFWENVDFIYVEHFCTRPEMRNRQYGEKALKLLTQREKTLILEIDPPIDELSMRRKSFYARCGFVENAFVHAQPPYHKDSEEHRMVLMSFPGAISPTGFDSFCDYIHQRVMKNAY